MGVGCCDRLIICMPKTEHFYSAFLCQFHALMHTFCVNKFTMLPVMNEFTGKKPFIINTVVYMYLHFFTFGRIQTKCVMVNNTLVM